VELLFLGARVFIFFVLSGWGARNQAKKNDVRENVLPTSFQLCYYSASNKLLPEEAPSENSGIETTRGQVSKKTAKSGTWATSEALDGRMVERDRPL